jgi:alanine racemase
LIYTPDDIIRITEAKLLRNTALTPVDQFLYDSRRLNFPETTLFFALSGPHRKGIAFIDYLFQKGVRHFMVQQDADESLEMQYQDANFYRVRSVIVAFQRLAAAHRNHFNIPIVGITGSNGKTIIKEWLFHLLHKKEHIVRSPRSYNSQIGVPISVSRISDEDTLGIFEAGISKSGEMESLEKIIRPDIGILTHIGNAHAEGFSDIREKIKEKLKLFSHAKLIILSGDDLMVMDEAKKLILENATLRLFVTGSDSNSDLQITQLQKSDSKTTIHYKANGEEGAIEISLTDEASISNVILCMGFIKAQYPNSKIESFDWSGLSPVEMRLELKQGIQRSLLINDSYSNDWDSLIIALDFLNQQTSKMSKTLIISDFPEVGGDAKSFYKKIANILLEKGVDKIIGIGPEWMKQASIFQSFNNAIFFSSTSDFLMAFDGMFWNEEAILIKGARTFEFERIQAKLEQKRHDTVLEIDLSALRLNLRTYRDMLNSGTKVMAMVKAFSYGSGSVEVAQLLARESVDYLAVAFTDEGVDLRRAGITLPIMVMNADRDDWSTLLEHQLEPEIFQIEQWQNLEQFLERQGIDFFPVHIKLDTGMHRLGFQEKDLPSLLNAIKSSNYIRIASIFTHLAASEDASQDDFTMQQKASFFSMSAQIESLVSYPIIKHLSNTSAIKRHTDLQSDMVRLGIGLYGVDANVQLQNVSTLKTTISQIKHLEAGDTVGYGRKGKLDSKAVIATVRIGYADGYPRNLGNGRGKMWLKGNLVPVIGNVCMDMTMLNITGIDTKEGDEIIVFGKELSVKQLADWADTIPYEILTGINQRVKRIYFEE